MDEDSDAVKHEILLTCRCTPAETPTRPSTSGIRVEEDLHSVALGRYDWQCKVIGRRWRPCRGTAAVVHQGCPVSISDFDKVPLTGGFPVNSEGGELQPQYLSAFYFYGLRLVKVVRMVVRVVRRGNITCGKESYQLSLYHSPSLPQPSSGQSVECIGCQSPNPVVELGAQAMSTSHWPQQHLETNGDCSVPPSPES